MDLLGEVGTLLSPHLTCAYSAYIVRSLLLLQLLGPWLEVYFNNTFGL